MDGLAFLVTGLFLITFGPPVIFLIVGMVKWKKNRQSARVFLILASAWFIIGGGMCLTVLTGG